MDTAPEPLAGLVREHRVIEAAVAETSARLAAAIAAPDDGALADGAVEQLWLLQLTLERDVALHIEKEEQVLFPVLRQAIARLSELIDDMISEHDEIKARRDLLSQTLTALDQDHDEVLALRAHLRDELNRVREGSPAADLPRLQEMVEQLDWVFQGHFTGEEDGLFLPAEDLLRPETLADMARRMAALEAGTTP